MLLQMATQTEQRKRRLPPEIFDLPVEKMREGYYTDVYFNFARETLRADGKALRARDTYKLEDRSGNEVAKIQERKLHVRDTMAIERGGKKIAEVHKRLVGLRDHLPGAEGEAQAPCHPAGQWGAQPEERQEAGRQVLRIAFEELSVHRVVGRLEARNTASARVLEKLGMRREAHLIENEYVKDEWQSEMIYAILELEWRALQRA